MQIQLKETPEQIELVKAMGSKNPTVAREAMEAVAGFVTPVIKEVLLTAGSAARIFRDIAFDEDSDPSIPLDLFYSENTGYVTVWSQHMAGGMPTSQVEGIKEMKFGTFRLDSAVSWNKKYARKNRLDVISRSIERMVQGMLIKQERNAWATVLKALAEASTVTVNGGTLRHGVGASAVGVFSVGDLNALITRVKRMNESFSGNTAVQPYSNGVTDLFVSPEVKGQIRAFAFQPLGGYATPVTASNAQTLVSALPDKVRDSVWSSAGMQSIFGVNINELIEFGAGQKYNTLFSNFVATSTFPGPTGGYWEGVRANPEIIVGVDNTRGALLRPVERGENGTLSVEVDGQWDGFGSRVEKQGYYMHLTEGRLVIDARALAGIAL